MKALFFDRDGTLIHDAGYLSNPDEVKYFDDTFEALERMKKLGFGFFIVTNQSGVGRGYFKEDCILKVHEKMQKDFQSNGLNLFDIAYCPHSPDDECDCRKPEPKMILDLANKHHIDLQESYMIGDKMSDVECGQNAGAKGILINTQKLDTNVELIFDTLSEIADYLENQAR